jgi:hypothetical protein
MVLRGQSAASGMQTVTVPDRGHAPILSGAGLIARLSAFVAPCEAVWPN